MPTPSLADLQAAVISILDLASIPAVLQLNNPTREKAFEAYLFGLFVKAIRRIHGTVVIRGILNGDNPPTVVFRGSPGRLGSQAQDFAYADCTLGSKRFEVHLGVQYQGNSGAFHEIDVSLYDHDTAESVRVSTTAANLFPIAKYKKLIAAIECKFYDSALSTSLGRTFIGLVTDCGSMPIKAFVSNGHHTGLMKYFSHNQKRSKRFMGLSPINTDEEDRIVRWIEDELRNWAKVD